MTPNNTIFDELSIGESLDSTTTSYLAGKELEDALASIGTRKRGHPLRDSWRSGFNSLKIHVGILGIGTGLLMAKYPWDEKEHSIYYSRYS